MISLPDIFFMGDDAVQRFSRFGVSGGLLAGALLAEAGVWQQQFSGHKMPTMRPGADTIARQTDECVVARIFDRALKTRIPQQAQDVLDQFDALRDCYGTPPAALLVSPRTARPLP